MENSFNEKEDDDYVIERLKKLSGILKSEKSEIIQNKEFGEIFIDKGYTGKSGYGLLHIIEGRNNKDFYNENEITALLFKVVDSVENGKFFVEQPNIRNGKNTGRFGIEKDGIIAYVSRVRNDKDEKFVLSGFALNEKKEEATEAIRTVIARYSYTPEFSDIRKQVGAVVSSLKVSPKSDELSRNNFDHQLEISRKAGYVQGVCECVAALGDNHILGKKLLSEMKVDKELAKKYANPDTYKVLGQGIFAQKQDQKLEQTNNINR